MTLSVWTPKDFKRDGCLTKQSTIKVSMRLIGNIPCNGFLWGSGQVFFCWNSQISLSHTNAMLGLYTKFDIIDVTWRTVTYLNSIRARLRPEDHGAGDAQQMLVNIFFGMTSENLQYTAYSKLYGVMWGFFAICEVLILVVVQCVLYCGPQRKVTETTTWQFSHLVELAYLFKVVNFNPGDPDH